MRLSLLKYNLSEWLRPRQWLQAILDYMKKVKLITSTVHTHPPGVGGANQRPRKIVCAVAYIGMRQVGGWVVQKLSKLVI